jgi:hypothetical protein
VLVFAAYLRIVAATPDTNYIALTPQHLVERIDRYGVIAAYMLGEFAQWKLWSLLWPGVALAIICLFACGQRFRATMATLVLLLPWPGLTLAYVLSAWSNYQQHINTSLSRLALEFAPFALFVIGLAVSASIARQASFGDFARQAPSGGQSGAPSPCL